MDKNQNKLPLSYRLGFVLGPLFIVLGIVLLVVGSKDGSKSNLPYYIMGIGLLRTIMSVVLLSKHKKAFQQRQLEEQQNENP